MDWIEIFCMYNMLFCSVLSIISTFSNCIFTQNPMAFKRSAVRSRLTAFLDLLILVVMVLSAVSLLAMALMFLVKNKKVTRFCFYLVVALGIYMGYVGVRINWPGFLPQVILAVLMALTGIGALALERLSKDSGRKLLIAKIAASIALVVGMFNAFA